MDILTTILAVLVVCIGYSYFVFVIRLLLLLISIYPTYAVDFPNFLFRWLFYVEKEDEHLKKAEELCKRFKQTISQPDVKVHFVGAW